METSLSRRCYICNAIISDDNPDGIGYSCRDAYNKAKYIWYSNNNPFGLWQLEVNSVMDLFIDTFKKVKFRSEFKKKFYPSIIEQYSKTGRISRKQLDICENMLLNKIPEAYYQLCEHIKADKKKIVDDYMHIFFEDSEESEIIEFRLFMKKQYNTSIVD